MSSNVVYPRSKTPVDKDLYHWAYENFGDTMAKAISAYKREFVNKHGHTNAFDTRK